MLRPPPISTLFPYTTLFRSNCGRNARKNSAVFGLSTLTTAPCQNSRRGAAGTARSEEHTSELQSHHDLVCRLLLEKKKKKKKNKRQPKQQQHHRREQTTRTH